MAVRGPYAKGTAKRAEVLAAALEVVARHGCRRTYVSEIAERVGLTQAGLMHYFRSREELYQEVIRTRDEHDYASYAETPRGIEGFFAVIEHNRQVPGLVQLYAEFSAEAAHPRHPSHDFFQQRYARLRESLEWDVRQAQDDGEMGPGADPSAIAELLMAAADGLQVQWLLDRDLDMVARLRALWQSLCAASRV
jgi:AcrR family transcriptional regulator